MKKKHTILLILIAILSISNSNTTISKKTCTFPTPDGALSSPPSVSNIDGKIVSHLRTLIKLQDRRTNKIIPFFLNKKTKMYTAFGGDFSPTELLKNQYAWVWYINCQEKATNKISTAGYLQIFSKNPGDQPDATLLDRGW